MPGVFVASAEFVAAAATQADALGAPDVIVTQVRRVALGPDGEPVPPRAPGADPAGGFSEMAMYVLVRRDGQWWLAAGQNTVLQPVPFAPRS